MDWKTGDEAFYRSESEMFNLAADYYDAYRPSYPGEIIRTLIEETGINGQSALLEIGAGSGKATALLADLKCAIRCVDPGAELVAKGNKAFKDQPQIQFECARFEDYEQKPDYYDMICAFQAFHWVPQPIGYQLCARQLKQTGHLALVWNMYIINDDDQDKELLEISARYGGFADFLSPPQCEKRITSVVKGIDDSGLFSQVHVYKQLWAQAYTADTYYGFCLTGNSFIQKSNAEKQTAYEEINDLANRHGGLITRPYLCVLYLTSKR